MSNSYPYIIKGSSSDGDLLSTKMSANFERGYISVAFFTDSEFTNQVIPSSGTITFKGSEDEQSYGTILHGTVDATTEEYDRPNFSGPVVTVKATCSSIVGASFYIATINKYQG